MRLQRVVPKLTVLKLVVAPLLVLLAGCATPVTDYQKGTDFSAYKTATIRQDDGSDRSIDAARVYSALEKYLPPQGIAVTDKAAALEVVSHFSEYARYDSNNVSFGFGATRNNLGVGVTAPISSEERKQYRLEIEFVDAKTKQVIWKARSANQMDEDLSAASRDKWIDNAVRKMLAKYPPEK